MQHVAAMRLKAFRPAIFCGALGAASLLAAFALASWHVVDAIRRTLGLAGSERGGPEVSASEIGAALLATASAALIVGAVALAVAARRAALTLERTSLIEIN